MNMTRALNVGSTIIGIGQGVASAIMYPKLFIPSLIVGTVVGTAIAVAHRVFTGKSLSTATKEAEAKLKQENPEQYKKNLNKNKIQAIGSLITGLISGGFTGYLLYAHLTSQSVNSVFSFMGGAGAVVGGFALGLGGSLFITDKIITAIDQRQHKSLKAIQA